MMQALALFWIALCLVVDTSTRSVPSTDDEIGIPRLFHGKEDGNLTTVKCLCENGFCEVNDTGISVCTCPPEWGLYGSTKCRKCNCGKDSNCTFDPGWFSDGKKCLCKVGYEDNGDFCKGTCGKNPCRNGGLCIVTGNDVQCKCPNSFSGDWCEKKEVSFPETSVWPSVWTSMSTRNWTFFPTRLSTTNEKNITTRTYKPSSTTFLLTSSPSRGHSLNFTFVRESTRQLTTLAPMTDADFCKWNPCKNGGMCKIMNGTVTCYCKKPFTGEFCESRIDPCTENFCQNGGTCIVVGQKPKCMCKKPYLGNLCEADPCEWNPCKNGGMCKTENETIKCYCKESFIGEFCESRAKIDTYVITLVAVSVFLAVVLIFVTCVLCQRYHVIKTT